MQILDNIFPTRLVDEIERAIAHVDTPWQYSDHTYGRGKQLRKGEVEEGFPESVGGKLPITQNQIDGLNCLMVVMVEA